MKTLLIAHLIILSSWSYIYSQNRNYPLRQAPAIENKEFTVIIATFGNHPIPPETVERVKTSVEIFNEYTQRISGNKIKVNSIISPVLVISDQDEAV